MAILGIDTFKERLNGGGARPNLFEVKLAFPEGIPGLNKPDNEKTSLMVKAAALPASQMGVIEVPFRGRVVKVAGDRTFDPWTVTIINDTDFEIRNSLEQWMNGINQHVENKGVATPADYQADLTVDQLDKDAKVIKTYVFTGCFPSNVSEIEVSYDTNDTIEEYTVEFQVQYWKSNTTS